MAKYEVTYRRVATLVQYKTVVVEAADRNDAIDAFWDDYSEWDTAKTIDTDNELESVTAVETAT